MTATVEAIERIDAPSRDVFERDYLRPGRPVILRNFTDGWMPCEEWTFARLAAEYGDAHVVAAVLRDGTLYDHPEEGALFRRVTVRDFVAAAAEPGAASLYIMAPATNFPDSFARDYRMPRYCAGAPHLRAKVWLGKAGTVTPMHRDVPHNLHVHLTGRKRWLLYPPGGRRMYSRGLASGMPNFSQIDPERPDYDRFPRFRGVSALGGIVEPGETLFIPHGWWHHTRTLENAVAMNFWWGGAVINLIAHASTLFKRVRRIRREEWGH